MANTTVVFARKHTVTNNKVIKEFTFRVFQGFAPVTATYGHKTRRVLVKAYRVWIRERYWATDSIDDSVLHQRVINTGFLSARSNEISYALTQFCQCESIKEMEGLLQAFRREFYVSMKKDAHRKLKAKLGPNKSSSSVLQSSSTHKPLPQITLPWDSEDNA